MAVKNHFDSKAWNEWDDEEIKQRTDSAVRKYTRKLKDEINFYKFIQFEFFKQWKEFREYVNSLGIKILGDMPIYVAMDSADTWAHPELFLLDENKKPISVAGCPPDYFSETGQLWGNPLYNWDYLKSTGYKWWFERIKAASKLFDITRIDHFRAFDTYYEIPYPSDNAINGKWKLGPNIDFFNKMKEELGDIPIIAEDLGELFDSVKKLLKETGYPGMKVLQFAFDGKPDNDFLPNKYAENCIVYTGTHDNDTVIGWYNSAPDYERENCKKYLDIHEGDSVNMKFIEAVYKCRADYAIIPIQDILGLDSTARINIPSTLGGNWTWRISKNALTKEISDMLRELSVRYSRLED